MKISTSLTSYFILFCCLFLASTDLLGQGSIKGRVVDDSGLGVIAATVYIEALQKGTVTDFDGNYSLTEVPVGKHILSISYTGYETISEEFEIKGSETITLDYTMSENATLLDEVVVVGYGTQRKRDLVGSVAKIETEELLDVVGGSFENTLQGKAPGLQITQSSGVAGAGSIVRVRGTASIGAGGDPLYVVDGIPITQDPFLAGNANGQNNNPLSSINPNDIESVEVLKDASAASIYGSRGANGVIIITTKRGRANTSNVDFSVRYGISEPTNVLDVLNADEWLQVRQEAWNNDGNVGRAPLPNVFTQNGLGYDEIEGIDTDWYDHVIGTGFKQEYNLGYSIGKEKFRGYFGGSYSDAGSYLKGNSFERISGRANLDFDLTKKLTVGLNLSVARGLNNKIQQAWAGGLGMAQTTALPIAPVFNDDGTYFDIYNNPLAQRELTSLKAREWRSINSININYRPNEKWSFNAVGNYDYMDFGDYTFEDSLWTNGFNIAKGGVRKTNNWNAYATGSYNFQLANPNHSLKAMVGIETQSVDVTGTYEEHQDFSDHIFLNPVKGENYQRTQFSEFDVDKWTFASVFTRWNYAYMDKFLVQLVYRRDASSKFGENKRWGDFPSVGLGYILSEEPFMQNGAINFFKVKASWGRTGNSDIFWREQYAQYLYGELLNAASNYNGQPIRYQSKLPNPDLQWEVNNNFDAGVEMGLFNDRITTSLTFYYKQTSEGFIKNSIQASSGIDQLEFWENVAKIRNAGIEFEFTTRNIDKKNFKWRTDFNITHNNSKVLDVASASPDALDGGFGDIRVIKGEPVGSNYLVRFSRVDPTTGRPIYLDKDGNETFIYDVSTNRVPTGNVYPDVFGGITNTFNYKNFELSVLFSYSVGGNIYDDAAKRQLGVVTDWNMSTQVFDRWRQPGDGADLPQLTMSMLNWGGNANFWQNNHTLWLYKADFIRLRNLTLAYNGRGKAGGLIKNYRIFFNTTNLLTFTNFPGWDPEIARDRESPQQRNVGGVAVTYLTPPQEKTFNLGLNVTF